MKKMAVIDNDFLNHLVELNNRKDAFELIETFFGALEYKVVMHPLVFKYEKSPISNNLMEKLFNEQLICVPELSEIWTNLPTGQIYYNAMVKQIYYEFTGNPYPCSDVCGDWKKQESLGEIHSAAMCASLNYDVFLSDDNAAVRYLSKAVETAAQKTLIVYNRQQCCDILKEAGLLNHKILNIISHKKK
ncbi:MAG: hypothetical protein FWD44_04060 [Oscillospiraceae bacterium]|nr:hypothetical protein [Oscillospiraceae bacterium]